MSKAETSRTTTVSRIGKHNVSETHKTINTKAEINPVEII